MKKTSIEDEITNRLSSTIYRLREAEKMSLRDLADKIGIGHSDLFRLESGTTKNPTIFTLRKIAKYFGLTVDELMNFDAKTCPTCGGRGWVK